MKLAIASLLVGSAVAFAPTANVVRSNSALNMATATDAKVSKQNICYWKENWILGGIRIVSQ